MQTVKITHRLEADYKRMVREGCDPDSFWAVVELIASHEVIPGEYRDHELQGEWAGVRDIHIEADWLLLYRIIDSDLILLRTGSHIDLFSKS
jgi:mRNA interferase YafQ